MYLAAPSPHPTLAGSSLEFDMRRARVTPRWNPLRRQFEAADQMTVGQAALTSQHMSLNPAMRQHFIETHTLLRI